MKIALIIVWAFKTQWILFYFIDEIDERITEIDKFSPSLKAEGTNCYATVIKQ